MTLSLPSPQPELVWELMSYWGIKTMPVRKGFDEGNSTLHTGFYTVTMAFSYFSIDNNH
jgi:hypothetical protein